MAQTYSYFFQCSLGDVPAEAKSAARYGYTGLIVSGIVPCRAMHPPDWELQDQWGIWSLDEFLGMSPENAVMNLRGLGTVAGVYKPFGNIDDKIHDAYVHSW